MNKARPRKPSSRRFPVSLGNPPLCFCSLILCG
ncbi:hypothetical protein MUK42_36102 [Musa troglodytarum]|uniref:Uncharacterized protein n=1 Tax=Musa troglodytarum TaxID=320322 RepID=A0A9E7GCH1_9LILI|nr:hypothetical protein MUK42_36102 [Musa troglodytarum]